MSPPAEPGVYLIKLQIYISLSYLSFSRIVLPYDRTIRVLTLSITGSINNYSYKNNTWGDMQKLVQIIYISRSTFENTDAINKIEPNVVRILAKSRINNRKNGLVGVLYFGDGAFFQCLEGDEAAINTLFAKIESDPRHKDVKLISKKYISRLAFPDWAMKYAPLDERMGKYLKENGYQSFDPYVFTPEMTQKILSLLIDAYDPTIEIESSHLNPTQQPVSKSSHFKNPVVVSLFFSVFACALSVATLLSVRGVI